MLFQPFQCLALQDLLVRKVETSPAVHLRQVELFVVSRNRCSVPVPACPLPAARLEAKPVLHVCQVEAKASVRVKLVLHLGFIAELTQVRAEQKLGLCQLFRHNLDSAPKHTSFLPRSGGIALRLSRRTGSRPQDSGTPRACCARCLT